MKKQKVKKVYISDINEHYNYENVKKTISEALEENFVGKEIMMICFRYDDYISLGERYAFEEDIDVKYISDRWLGVFKKPGWMKTRRIVKLSDFMLIFRGKDISEVTSLFECAVRFGTPLYMRDIS